VTSSNNAPEALLWVKIKCYDEMVIKNLKRKRDGYQTNFNMNFHIKHIYECNSSQCEQ